MQTSTFGKIKKKDKAFALFYKLSNSVLIGFIFKLLLYTRSYGSLLSYQLQFLKLTIINVPVPARVSRQW